MKRSALAFLLVVWSGLLIPGNAQEDFLTPGEIENLRDKQEPDKRLILYLDFAQRRLDAIQENLASKKAGAGRAAQKFLKEYTAVLEALEVTVEAAREKRVMTDKILKETERREGEFLTYLRSLNAESSAGFEDYRFTLDEAIVMTEEGLAETKKGSFPELREREPPRLPATPPPPPRTNDRKPDEEGPPRKGRRTP